MFIARREEISRGGADDAEDESQTKRYDHVPRFD